MKGIRNVTRAGYAWHIFAYFSCNAGGVRIAVRKTPEGAERFAQIFSKKNNVETMWRLGGTRT
jgi:hypothetical protein